jgi:antitoxin-like ribbon-helix-helix protein
MSKTPRAKLGTTGVFQTTAPEVAATSQEKRPDRAGRTAMPFWVPVAARKQLRMLAAELDSTQQKLMTEALNMLFQKHRKPPIA